MQLPRRKFHPGKPFTFLSGERISRDPAAEWGPAACRRYWDYSVGLDREGETSRRGETLLPDFTIRV